MTTNKSTSCALSSDEDILINDSKNHESRSVQQCNTSEIPFCERLKICFTPNYRSRKVKNKGALLLLLWNFLVTTVFYYNVYKYSTPENICPICFELIPVPVILANLFTVWLADAYFQRYKIIRLSVFIMWISSFLLTVTFVIEMLATFTNSCYYQLVLLVLQGIGFGMFVANIIQFAMDQLRDASTNEMVSFIYWYVWTYVGSAAVINFISKCSNLQHKFLPPLLLFVALSIVVCSLFMCNHVLIKEPPTQNPFKLIVQVLKYALRHNYARKRSAFTYHDYEIPSRLDFGKHKYGGPFTTEQVEDVKTFFRALGFVVIVGFISSMKDESTFQIVLFSKTLIDQVSTVSLKHCAYIFLFTDIKYLTMVIVIPLNEFVVNPLFQRCLPTIWCYWKIVIGLVMQVLRYALLLVFVTSSRLNYVRVNKLPVSNNSTPTLPCLFYNDSTILADNAAAIYDYRFEAIPDVISSVAFIMIFVGAIEYICSQMPYSMRSVFIALYYGSLVVFFALNKMGIAKIFKVTSLFWSSDSLFGCEFWYLLTKLLLVLAATLIFFLLAVLYKRRKRDDVLPNEHIFAERYYSRKLQQID